MTASPPFPLPPASDRGKPALYITFLRELDYFISAARHLIRDRAELTAEHRAELNMRWERRSAGKAFSSAEEEREKRARIEATLFVDREVYHYFFPG